MNTTLRPPRWIVQSILPVSMTLVAIVFALLLSTSVTKFIQGRRAGGSTPDKQDEQ